MFNNISLAALLSGAANSTGTKQCAPLALSLSQYGKLNIEKEIQNAIDALGGVNLSSDDVAYNAVQKLIQIKKWAASYNQIIDSLCRDLKNER